MPALLIKDIPPELHSRLKQEAARNHRSMNRHVLAILEKALVSEPSRELPAPAKGKFLLTDRWLHKAKREGRK
jgi:plasmid stability protein